MLAEDATNIEGLVRTGQLELAPSAEAALLLYGVRSLAELAPNPKTRKKDWYWFALDDTQPLFAFAGLWCDWHGTRGTKKEPIEGQHHLYAFLTTEPNGVVEPIHSKAMPATLTTPEEFDTGYKRPSRRLCACSGRCRMRL